MAREKHFICRQCGFVGPGLRRKKGSGVVEKLLWFILLVPGPFYSLWRYLSAYHECPKCHDRDMVSLDTPEGEVLFQRQMHKWK